jgi:uncharacterized membrane protein YgaE (UPF0421/DUF939 family)
VPHVPHVGGNSRRSAWHRRLRRTWARHPRLGLALKAALAASLAWALVRLVPGPAADYPYYAPLGAVLATSTTLAGSVREALQAVGAIALGAALALAVDAMSGPNLVTIAVVVALGILLGSWNALGGARSWVPTSALFVLIIGNADPGAYVLGYAGLTLLGALVGLAVTAAFPPLPLAPAQQRLRELRDTLAGQLEDLVDGLRQDHPPSSNEWQRRTRTIDPVLAQMRRAVQETDEARRGNPRARRYRHDADRQYAQARALERLTLLVEDLTQLIADTERAENERVALGPALRPAAVRALSGLAEALRSVDGASADADVTSRAYEHLERFTDDVRRLRLTTDDDLFEAGNVVQNVRRSLDAIRPHPGPPPPPGASRAPTDRESRR